MDNTVLIAIIIVIILIIIFEHYKMTQKTVVKKNISITKTSNSSSITHTTTKKTAKTIKIGSVSHIDNGSELLLGDILPQGYCLVSKNGLMAAIMYNTGDFVLYDIKNGITYWSSNSRPPIAPTTAKYELVLESSGNLTIIMLKQNRTIWQSNTAGKGITKLEISNNGDLNLLDAQKNIIWKITFPPQDAYKTSIIHALALKNMKGPYFFNQFEYNQIKPGFILFPTWMVISPNQQYAAYMGSHGRLIIYKISPVNTNNFVIANHIPPANQSIPIEPRYYLQYINGNLIILGINDGNGTTKTVWSSNTSHIKSTTWRMADDGQITLYNGKTKVYSIK
ncbi:MAG: hypothetical protein ACYCPT_12185 [Acidimicrobiales bacterium]